jgi:hypothetical protein
MKFNDTQVHGSYLGPTTEQPCETILDDFTHLKNLGSQKNHGIRKKRYNEEISGAGLSPDGNFSVVKKNPG